MIVPGMFVCSSFLSSVCMFIVSKALLISSATVIVRAGGGHLVEPSCRGSHLVEPLCYGISSVCSAVTVECCVWYVCCYVEEKALLQCLYKSMLVIYIYIYIYIYIS